MNATPKRPTLAGRILRGIGQGILDGLPLVSQVVNTVRQAKAEREAPVPVPSAEPVTRTVTGWATLVGLVATVVASIANGAVDCAAVQALLDALGVGK